MKALTSLIIILTACSLSAAAQSTQVPPIKPILSGIPTEGANVMKYKLRNSTVTVIRSHNINYRLDSVKVLKSIKKEWVSDCTIKRDSTYTTGEGYNFRNTVIITLKDDAYPEAFTTLKQSLIAI